MMNKESFVMLLDVYDTIGKSTEELLKVLVGNALTMVGYDEGFLGKLTYIERIIRLESHPSFQDYDENENPYYMGVLENIELTNEEKADILLNPRVE